MGNKIKLIKLTNNESFYKKSKTVYSDEMKSTYVINLVVDKIEAVLERLTTTVVITNNGTFHVVETPSQVLALINHQ